MLAVAAARWSSRPSGRQEAPSSHRRPLELPDQGLSPPGEENLAILRLHLLPALDSAAYMANNKGSHNPAILRDS